MTNNGGREGAVLASGSGKLFAITAPQDVNCTFFQAVWLSVCGDGLSVGVRQKLKHR